MREEADVKIAQMKEELNCNRSMTVTKRYVVPAIGPVLETLEFYADDVADGEKNPGGTDFRAFCVKVTRDARPTTMGLTEEVFLYAPDTYKLAGYCKNGTWTSPVKDKAVKKASDRLLKGFDLLMNR